MKISDIVFEMETNYVSDDDIALIEAYIRANGFNPAKVDEELVKLGYDPIFGDIEEDGYETVQKIPPKKHLVD